MGRRWRRTALATAAGLVALAVMATDCITSAGVTGNVLTIAGSGGADVIVLRLKSGDANVLGVDDGDDGTTEYSFDRSTFTSIVVDGDDGDDVITVNQVNGLFTTTEVTTLLGGAGRDQLVGGSGTDRLVFTGSNASQSMALSNVAGQVQLTRNVAAIVMDLAGVESVDLDLLAGIDVLTVNDLIGTDQTTLTADLGGSGAVDDGAVDEVRVPAATVIGRSGAASSGNLASVVSLSVSGGSGRDTMLGGADEDVVTWDPGDDTITSTPAAAALLLLSLLP